MDVDHNYCNLRDKSNAELAEIVAKAAEQEAWAEAWHAAHHHHMLCHPIMGPQQLNFFRDELPALNGINSDHAESMASWATAKDNITAVFESGPEVPEVITGLITAVAERYGKTQMMGMGLMGLWTGTSLAVYVMSRGEGCIFSLIDKTLCKEDMR